MGNKDSYPDFEDKIREYEYKLIRNNDDILGDALNEYVENEISFNYPIICEKDIAKLRKRVIKFLKDSDISINITKLSEFHVIITLLY